eukprot:COSAG02_NODE_5590_length_4207_cov_1.795034_6_plen_107_part_00
MSDIVGLDLGMPRDDDLNPVPRNPEGVIQDALVAAGRLGQKSGGGFFDYDDSRKASPSAEVAELIAKVAANNGTAQQEIPVSCVSTLDPPSCWSLSPTYASARPSF